jgi:transposase
MNVTMVDPGGLGIAGRGDGMREPDEVAAMVRLRSLGWGVRRIASELGCSHMTVRRYLAAGGWVPYRAPERASALDGLEAGWLAERFRRYRGNADVVRQDLEREYGIRVSLRTVERAVAPLRRELTAEARATVRFETPDRCGQGGSRGALQPCAERLSKRINAVSNLNDSEVQEGLGSWQCATLGGVSCSVGWE